MKNGFVKIASVTPRIALADPIANAKEMAAWVQKADKSGVKLLCFPALSLSGATAGDLFFSDTLIQGCRQGLDLFLEATGETETVSLVGLPFALGNALYRAVAVCQKGRLLGIVPQRGNPRYFARPEALCATADGAALPFGRDLCFSCTTLLEFSFCIASSLADARRQARKGAALICIPTAEPALAGAAERQIDGCRVLSRETASAILLTESGLGESTTDLVYAGQGLIAENGKLLARRPSFCEEQGLLISEIDVSLLTSEKRKQKNQKTAQMYCVEFSLSMTDTALTRFVDPHPFMPADPILAERRCEEILTIQARGLVTRVERAYAKKLVLGISGGLDSTLALLVMARAMDILGRPHSDILAVTMPCFGTTERTKTNATVLCQELGTDFRCVNIFDAVNQHFKDIGHDPEKRDVTYENSQARERTQILMDIANDVSGMVIGTGDLSELALGWATYNGDHMSMYAVNGSVPKTLVRHLVSHEADRFQRAGRTALSESLYDVLNTPVSPELLPADEGGKIAQKTEDLVGPYELHDFYLYYMLRYGFSPKKLYRLAKTALGDTYDDDTMKKWLKVFLRRFFNQQFKRSCLPDGPKVGRVSLSPRGDWCMPSDALSTLWLSEAEEL